MKRLVGILMGIGLLVVGVINLVALRWGHAQPILIKVGYLSVWLILATGALWIGTAFWQSRVALWIQICLNGAWALIVVLDARMGNLTGVLFLLAAFVLLIEYANPPRAARRGIAMLSALFLAALLISLHRQTPEWLLESLSSLLVCTTLLAVYGIVTYKHWILLRNERQVLDTRVRERTRQLESSLEERKVMLKEIHHRVKNNLQIIASLLRLEAGENREAGPSRTLERSIRRIHSMALVHETLYQSQALHLIDLGAYLGELVSSVRATLDSSVTVDLEIRRSRTVDPDFAIPFGLLVTEIITTLTSPREGASAESHVRLWVDCGSTIDLIVKDSEAPDGQCLDLQSGKGLSPTLIRSVIEQLHGRFDVAPRRGVRLEVDLPPPRSA